MRKVFCAFVLPILLASSGLSFAHSGGLNKEGCHNNRSTGDYHCHRGAGPPPPPSGRVNALSAPPAESTTRAFASCAEARAAGAAPVRRGDPGYGKHLDRDNDGVGCE